MRSPELHLRPAEEADLSFLRGLYASTRAQEMALTGWTQPAIDAFLDQQFDSQHRYYQSHYPDADFLVIEVDGHSIGRAYLAWGDSNLQIIDIALVPDQRGQGIGSRLLHEWLERADRDGLTVGLYVEPYNPALQLYLRDGFEVVGESGVYLKLTRPAKASHLALH